MGLGSRTGSGDADGVDVLEVLLLVVAIAAFAGTIALAVRWAGDRQSSADLVAQVRAVGNADVPSPAGALAQLAPTSLDIVAHGGGGTAVDVQPAPGYTARRSGVYSVTVVPPTSRTSDLSWDIYLDQSGGVTTTYHVSGRSPAPVAVQLQVGDTLALGARTGGDRHTGPADVLGSMRIARTGDAAPLPAA